MNVHTSLRLLTRASLVGIVACAALLGCSSSADDGAGRALAGVGGAGGAAGAAGVGFAGTLGASGGGAGSIGATAGASSSAGASGSAGTNAAGSGGVGAFDAGSMDAEVTPEDGGAGGSSNTQFALPPLNQPFDYQLGGAYAPPSGVKIVSRDRNESIAAGLYNICYVNGFQIQSEENSFWTNSHPDLILRDSGGQPVIDQDWDETLIDVSTPEKRTAVAQIVAGWIQGCASAGFDAIEIDNLDSYSRSGGLLSEDNAVDAMKLFSTAAHAAGLAIAQKNSSELVGRHTELGTDFVVAEECNRYDECDDYKAGYGDHVLVIEYRRADFDTGCSKYPELSIVLRDVDLVTPGDGQYVYDGC